MNPLRTVALFALLVLPSCLEMEQTITLEADGSGRQNLKMVVRESTLKELQMASAAAQLGPAPNPTAVFDKKLVESELRAAGLELVSHVAKKVPGKRSVELEAKFADFAALQKSPLCGSSAEWVITAGPKEGTAKLTLYPQGKASWMEARAKAEEMVGKVDPVAADFFRKSQEKLTGLDMKITFKLPGDVLIWTRNMERTGEREVTAVVTAEQIQTPQDLVRRLAPRFEVIFASTGCKLPLQ
jgi:hypothetical protein